MLQFTDFQDRIGPMRPDRLPREWQLAFQVAVRRLCQETMALQYVVEFTMPTGSTSQEILYTNDDGLALVSVYIFKAEYEDTQGNWNELRLHNQEQMREHSHVLPSQGIMRAFTSTMGRFQPNVPPAVDTNVRALVAFKPTGDFDAIDLGVDYEDAIVAGALAHLLRLPGTERDLNRADAEEVKFMNLASSLRGAVLVGDAGYARASKGLKHHKFGFFNTHRLTY